MKRWILPLGTIAFLIHATVTSTLDPAQLSTITTIYQTNDLVSYSTKNSAVLRMKASNIYDEDNLYELSLLKLENPEANQKLTH